MRIEYSEPLSFRLKPEDERHMVAIERAMADAGRHFIRKSDVIRHALLEAATALQTARVGALKAD
jgi:hypothetical protein